MYNDFEPASNYSGGPTYIDLDSGSEITIPSEDPYVRRAFALFKQQNPQYVTRVISRMEELYDTFFLLYNRRFGHLEDEQLALAEYLGFGMLLRHTVETLTMSLCVENGIDVGEETTAELLSLLENVELSEQDAAAIDVLHHTRHFANNIAHPHAIKERTADAKTLLDHYKKFLRPTLMAHIIYVSDALVYERTDRATRKLRHAILKYLIHLKNLLDDFSIKDKFTSRLILGCLIRQLTECAVNLWAFNYYLLPTDASREEHTVDFSEVLSLLAYSEKHDGFAKQQFESLNPFIIKDLYELKNFSNCFMHVESFNPKHVIKLGKELPSLYEAVRVRCAPVNMQILFRIEPKRKKAERFSKESAITAVLCGVFGWLGAHHFYAGNILKGIIFLVSGGFYIGPIISLVGLCRGNFKTRRFGTLPSTPLNTLIAIPFIALHIYLLYLLLSTPIGELGVFSKLIPWNNFYE